MPLVDDGIKYKSDNKSDGYELIDGTKDTDLGIKPQKAGRKPKLNTPYPNYSTVTECSGYGVFRYPNSLLCFDIDLSSQNLTFIRYSAYQHFLFQTITDLRNKEMNDVQIANWLNDNGYKTPRGSTFRNNHVHSIAKKRTRRLEIVDTEPSMSISNMNVKYIGKSA